MALNRCFALTRATFGKLDKVFHLISRKENDRNGKKKAGNEKGDEH
jgi:hypothetical protein